MRYELPVYSPLTFHAVLAGFRGLVSGRALERVTRLIEGEYGPLAVRLTDSGTTALALAMRLAADGQPPLVAMPAYSCYDLATAADAVDARVVLYDVDPRTLGPVWASFEAALASGPSAVVIAHLYGVPVDMDRASEIAGRAGVTVIEDAAQGVGGRYRGRPLGTHAPLAILSFGRGKGRTGGRGGALLVHDQRFVAPAEALELPSSRGTFREWVLVAAQWLLGRPSLYGLVASVPAFGLGETVYRTPGPARRMSGVAAEVLAGTWALEPGETVARRERARQLGAENLIAVPEGAEPGWLRVPDPQGRERVNRRKGLMPGYPRALVDLEGFGARIVNPGHILTGARLLSDRLTTLPAHSQLEGQTARTRPQATR